MIIYKLVFVKDKKIVFLKNLLYLNNKKLNCETILQERLWHLGNNIFKNHTLILYTYRVKKWSEGERYIHRHIWEIIP